MRKNVFKKCICDMLAAMIILSTTVFPATAKTKTIKIGGEAFGLKLYCKGVIVTKLEGFSSKGAIYCPAKKCGINVGDIIEEINDKKINTNEEMERQIKKSGGSPLNLKLKRDGKIMNLSIRPEKDELGDYRTGMWIRDSCAGIGTISYYNERNGSYAALGHGICDTDTGGLMNVKSGEIVGAVITSVTKSKNNNIGTLNGYFDGESIGTIINNSELGIHGQLINAPKYKKEYEVSNDINVGKASLYTTLDSSGVKKYDIEITSICNNFTESNKNFTIRITDKNLINKTGGIVQGMSGSPIIQNGKFVGALTHVFLESCTEGYGILANNLMRG